ncbi:hypothetical protein CCS38_30605 [Streptomyces purpurogeneiscleroticus]|nr:hypothetical protein [Streptomyces purpurogeneiscleroticus]
MHPVLEVIPAAVLDDISDVLADVLGITLGRFVPIGDDLVELLVIGRQVAGGVGFLSRLVVAAFTVLLRLCFLLLPLGFVFLVGLLCGLEDPLRPLL